MPLNKKIGTLVVVVLKARNLKDSHTFYKQDPYALVRLAGTDKQTQVDRRGGQHPVWDEELHFPVFEIGRGVDQRTLAVSVYAKENKADELLGEGNVDISETLRKGEFDDWVRLELDGGFRGDIYLEMTYYSDELPLARRPSKLLANERLSRPPPTPPKDTTSPNFSPRVSPKPSPLPSPKPSPLPSPKPSPLPSPRMPSIAEIPVHLHPGSSPHFSPSPGLSPPPALSSGIHRSSPPHQSYVDPTLKNIPFLDVGPSVLSASSPPQPPITPPAPAPALHSVPSILRPRHVKSSPIPVPSRDDIPPPVPPKVDDPNKRFQQELSDSDAAFAARLAWSEGIDVDRLRAEEADAELARRLALDDGIDESERSVPGGWRT